LFNANRWPVLYCDAYALRNDDLPENDGKGPILPALKMEISWSPKKHYDAFDVSEFTKKRSQNDAF
jgi:hypothetical protein